ncbi:metalloregulator ArsR/SmtB family transcription factor, partial [Christensenellaceae bacterium OttesenSCG-928-M15]|nr:metalloregulator ArsR/SmtB family transcription factor [Christensenellaceae bacterium OttesenSCG-928-M15]
MDNHTLPHNHGDDLLNVLSNMPDADHFAQAAATFQQLCDGSRLRILWLLCHCEECVINIAAAVNMSSAAVSHHLKNLRLNGLITSRRAGKEVYYTLADTKTAQLVHGMVDDFFELTCPNKGLRNH